MPPPAEHTGIVYSAYFKKLSRGPSLFTGFKRAGLWETRFLVVERRATASGRS